MIREPRTPEEVGAIAMLGRQVHAVSSFSQMPFSFQRTIESIYELLDTGQYCRCDYSPEGDMRGVMGGILLPALFTNELMAFDIALMTVPGAGNGSTAYRLVRDFTRWAKAHGARQIRPATSTGAASGRADKLYEALGFTRVGSSFVMEV